MQKTAFCGRSARGSDRRMSTISMCNSDHTANHGGITKTLLVTSREARCHRTVKNVLVAMNLTFVLLTAGFLNVCASGLSQNVTFSGKNVSLESVFSSIKNQTGFVFLYGGPVLKAARPVTVSASGLPLEDFLTEIFRDQPLEYSIDGKSILVSPKITAYQPADMPALPHLFTDNFLSPILITGRVTDSLGQPLVGASVYVKQGKASTSTDINGHFSLHAEVGQTLIISCSRYGNKEIKIISSATADHYLPTGHPILPARKNMYFQ